jgi:DNA-binding XRE family transcriptional regulator
MRDGVGDMETRHMRWERTGADEHAAAYEEARASLMLGQMVHDRRVDLGLTQAELAERAGMTQPQLSRLESGGATPTVPLLARIAAALNADLDIAFRPHRSVELDDNQSRGVDGLIGARGPAGPVAGNAVVA